MSVSRRQYRAISEIDLIKMAHTSELARQAVDRLYDLKQQGKHPEIQYSRANGFRVFDPNDEFLDRLKRR